MMRTLLGGFVLAHGLVTIAIWAAPRTADAPFDPGSSWLLGESRRLAITTASVAAITAALAGVAYVAQQDWWAVPGIAAGAAGVTLMLLYFNFWLIAGLAINVAILSAAVQAL